MSNEDEIGAFNNILDSGVLLPLLSAESKNVGMYTLRMKKVNGKKRNHLSKRLNCFPLRGRKSIRNSITSMLIIYEKKLINEQFKRCRKDESRLIKKQKARNRKRQMCELNSVAEWTATLYIHRKS